jgi:hypothetical protein
MADTAPTDTDRNRSYGWNEPRSVYGPQGIVAQPERTSTGNVVLRAGNENDGPGSGWTQSVYIVLTPAEASDLAAAIKRAAQVAQLAPEAEQDRAQLEREVAMLHDQVARLEQAIEDLGDELKEANEMAEAE